jgi:hypothetical protein
MGRRRRGFEATCLVLAATLLAALIIATPLRRHQRQASLNAYVQMDVPRGATIRSALYSLASSPSGHE